ncbi:uncharacterized protein ACMZJ9_015381 [Mantella aurantiaca]
MEKTKSHVNAILDLTLEIVYLLTGENYSLVKTSSLERDIYPPMSRKWSRTQSPNTVPPTSSLKLERNNEKILEVTQKMIGLLTGEVPIRCQDVTVYFSMEEWEYIEGHKDLYKDVMMEKRPPLTSPDGSSNRNPPKRCPRPLYSRDSTQEHQEIPQEDQVDGSSNRNPPERSPRPLYSRNSTQEHQEIRQEHQGDHLIVVKVESDEEELYLRDDGQYLDEEEILPEMRTGGGGQRTRGQRSEEHLASSPEYDDLVDDSPGEDPFTNNLHPHLHSADRSPDPSNPEESYPDTLYPLSPDLHPDLSMSSRSPSASSYGLVLVDTADTETHGVVEPFFCSPCVKWFLLKLPPGQHKTAAPKVPFLCPDCGRSLTQHEGLPQPRRTDIVKLTHVCFECGRCFTVESNLFRHRLTHGKARPCQRAEGEPQLDQGADRQRVHSGEGLLECSECGEQLSGKTCLLSHERLHAGEKAYPDGGKRFEDQVMLYRHHERVFQDYKPFSCPECGKFYTSKSVLNRHLKLHSDYKPFPCSVCGKCFANKSLLNSHRRVHSKPFSCAECGRCFTFRYHLTKHEQTHAGGSHLTAQREGGYLYANELLDSGTPVGQTFKF